ncbi:MAG: DUF4397 domain-containing protein [Sphingobacteriia bacterium]|nr:DUF4397 domain-containing protein [Sphingobacteriia bacterium]
MNKKYLYFNIVLFASLTMLIWSCKKNELRVSPFDYTDGMGMLKINYASPYALNPSVQIKINGEKVSPSNITYATPFPGGGLNTGGSNYADYFSVLPGTDSILISIPKKNSNEDSIILFKTTVNVVANKYQTLHIADTSAATQTVYTVDPGNKPDSGRVLYRFINLCPNSTGLDLYFGTTMISSNVAYKQVTDTFSLPAGNSLAWSLRTAGGTTTLSSAATYTNSATVANQRVFTVYARGYIGLPTTDIRTAKLSLLYNK